MSARPFSLKINGGTEVPLKSLGLALTGIQLSNMQADVASLRWSRKRASVACPLAHNDSVEIFRAGVRIFVGRARIGQVNPGGCPVQLLGPWSHLDELIFQVGLDGDVEGPRLGETFTETISGEYWDPVTGTWQPQPPSVTWTWGTETLYTPGASVGTLDLNYYWTSRSWLFRPVGSSYKTVADQYADLLAFDAHVSDSPAMTTGVVALGGSAAPKVRTVEGLPTSEAIRQTLAIKPDMALWFDYSGSGLPTLNARVASLETPLALVVGQRTGTVMSDYGLVTRDDLIPDGVMIRWEGDVSTVTGCGRPYLVDRYPAGITSTSPRILIQTITESVNRVSGLAEEIYNSLATRRTSGQLTIRDDDLSLGLRPGRVLSLSGDAQLDGVQHWIQTVNWNPLTGLASCQVGYPDHLSLRDRLDLRGWLRRVFYVPGALVSQVVPPPA